MPECVAFDIRYPDSAETEEGRGGCEGVHVEMSTHSRSPLSPPQLYRPPGSAARIEGNAFQRSHLAPYRQQPNGT